MRSCSGCAGSPSLSDGPAYQYDAFYLDTRPARQLSEEIVRTEKVAPRDYSRLEGALVDLGQESPVSSRRAKAAASTIAPACSGKMSPRARRAAGRARRVRDRCERRSRRAAARGAARVRRARTSRRRPRPARSIFSICFSRRATWFAMTPRCAAASSSASSVCSSTSSRTPIRCRRRSCCCWLPTIPPSRIGAKVSPRPRQALHRRRSEAVDLSIQARRRRHLPRRLRDAGGGGSEARDAANQLSRRPNIQRTINASFEPVMTGDDRCALAGRLRAARAVPVRSDGAAVGGRASRARAVRQTADRQHVDRGVAAGCRRRVRGLADSRERLEGRRATGCRRNRR